MDGWVCQASWSGSWRGSRCPPTSVREKEEHHDHHRVAGWCWRPPPPDLAVLPPSGGGGHVDVVEVQVRMEGSSKWPEDVTALRQAKTAFLIHMARQ